MPTVETPETTTTLGLKLVRTLKASCDKSCVLPFLYDRKGTKFSPEKLSPQIANCAPRRGRLVATQFLDVPDKVRKNLLETYSVQVIG